MSTPKPKKPTPAGSPAGSPPACEACRHFAPAPGGRVGDCREGPPTVLLGLPGRTAPVHAYRVVPAALPACGRFAAG